MEKFEYGKKKVKFEKMKERALSMGMAKYKIYNSLLPIDCGKEIDNNFPNLTDLEINEIEKLYSDKDRLEDDYKKIIKILEPLIVKEKELSIEIQNIKNNICLIQGHRLDEDSYRVLERGYGYRCLVCSKIITNKMINDNDVLVSNKSYKRVLYKK